MHHPVERAGSIRSHAVRRIETLWRPAWPSEARGSIRSHAVRRIETLQSMGGGGGGGGSLFHPKSRRQAYRNLMTPSRASANCCSSIRSHAVRRIETRFDMAAVGRHQFHPKSRRQAYRNSAPEGGHPVAHGSIRSHAVRRIETRGPWRDGRTSSSSRSHAVRRIEERIKVSCDPSGRRMLDSEWRRPTRLLWTRWSIAHRQLGVRRVVPCRPYRGPSCRRP